MQKEIERTDRKQNITLLTKYLDSTRGEKKKDANKMSAKNLVQKYPALKIILW